MVEDLDGAGPVPDRTGPGPCRTRTVQAPVLEVVYSGCSLSSMSDTRMFFSDFWAGSELVRL